MARTVILGIGGGGSKVTNYIERHKDRLYKGIGEDEKSIGFFYMDTARIDEVTNINNDQFIKLDYATKAKEVQGGGGMAREVFDIYTDMGDSLKVPVADMYILIYTVDRATGRVVGPELHKRLYDAGKNVWSIVLYDNSVSVNSAGNNVKAIKTLRAYSAKKHFLVTIVKNHIVEQSKNDERVLNLVVDFTKLTSKYNVDIDPADVRAIFNLGVSKGRLGVDVPNGLMNLFITNSADQEKINDPIIAFTQKGEGDAFIPRHVIGKTGELRADCPFLSKPVRLEAKNNLIGKIIDQLEQDYNNMKNTSHDDGTTESDKPFL